MSATKRIQETFQQEYSGKNPELKKIYKQRLVEWRAEPVFVRVKKPTNIARARALGYKAKIGFVVVRTKIRRGGRRKQRPKRKRKPSKSGVLRFLPQASLQAIAEQRIARKFKNMEVLNSYFVGEDGQHKFFEAILVDPQHPSIKNDKNINWVLNQRRRAFRGLTSAGNKHRILVM